MNEFWRALNSNTLLFYALIAAAAASIASGIIGSYVVVKRIVFIAGSISHAVLGGIGFCLWLQRIYGVDWATPLLGALAAAILSAFTIGWMHLYCQEREDSAIASLWSIGMAMGVIFISQTPGFTGELANYLLGNILWVSRTDLFILLGLDLTIVIAVAVLYQRLLALCFDEEQARLQGISVNGLYFLLLTLIAISVVLLIEVVGIILVLTMLTIPAALANLFSQRMAVMMLLAIGMNMLFSLVGMALAFELDWPSGASIALLIGSAYLSGMLLSKIRWRKKIPGNPKAAQDQEGINS